MKLSDLFSVITNNASLSVTLIDVESEKNLITFNASGYESVEDTIQAREVKKVKIETANSIKVFLGGTVEDSTDDNTSDPTNTDPDPSNP